jgi:hypothetical protein
MITYFDAHVPYRQDELIAQAQRRRLARATRTTRHPADASPRGRAARRPLAATGRLLPFGAP